jgi:hypothetical protein
MRLLFALGPVVLTPVACADVPEREIGAVLDHDGARFRGVIRFSDHHDEFEGGDGSCGWLSGNCGQRSTTVRFTCKTYSSSLGERVECFGTTKTATLTVTPRD